MANIADNSWRCPECGTPVNNPQDLDNHWKDSHIRNTTRLRQWLEGDRMLLAPFCLNAFHAKIAEMSGLSGVYMTGFGTSAERGFPDVGLTTQTEMVQNARYITSAVNIPVICDADTGYGNPINVKRTVREYESAGVAGCHIEDQVFPKKCGFFEGKDVIPMEEHVQKIRAAVDGRKDADFVIIARSDALAVTGWEDTIRRCRAYVDAGADLVFVDGIRTKDDLHIYAQSLKDLPKLYNGMLMPAADVENLGFKIMIAGGTLGVMFHALKEAMEELGRTGTVTPRGNGSRDEITNLLGLPQIYEMERLYEVSAARFKPTPDTWG